MNIDSRINKLINESEQRTQKLIQDSNIQNKNLVYVYDDADILI